MTVRIPALPHGWISTRVDRVASVNARIGWKALTADEYQSEGYAFLATPNIKGRTIDFQEVNYITEERYEESPELKLQSGDVLLAKDGNTLGIVNIVTDLPRPATVNGSIAVIRPFGIDPAFLRYVLASEVTQAAIEMLKGGMGVPHLFQWDINRLPVPMPTIEEQRQIANFLDIEIARIDAMRSLRARMRTLLAMKRERIIESVLGLDASSMVHRMVPLKYLAGDITVGIVITPAKWYVEEGGVPALRGLNVRPGTLSLEDLAHISPAGHTENQKSQLRAGDLVVVRTGQAGAAAIVPPSLDGANCIDLIIIRPGRRLSSRYLEYTMNSDYARRRIAEHSVGSIQSHFNVGSMKELPIPAISLAEQEAAITELNRIVPIIDDLLGRFASQDKLLTERRQALITAAVTGQFDVSSASGRGVEE